MPVWIEWGSLLWLLLAGLLAVPTGVFVVEILAAVCAGSRSKGAAVQAARPAVTILMPAHNEELVIEATLRKLQPHLRAGDRVLVVADNCSDRTAELVRAAGGDVTERFNSRLRGKGYALDHGVRQLERGPAPHWVLILDADCTLHPGAVDALWAQVQATGRPAQAVYLMEHDPANRAVSPVAVFAWRVRNLVRPKGMWVLGGPCHLTGSGMAFPWPLLRQLPLASGHIVEDMKMGVDLAKAGHPPVLALDALVTSTFPVSKAGAQAQRTRWEHGTLGMLLHDVPRMLLMGLLGQGRGVLALAVDMLVPPLALLAVMLLAVFGGTLAWSLFAGHSLALMVMAVELVLFFVAVTLAWWTFGRDIVSPAQVPALFGYVMSKFPIYAQFLVKRQMEWVRSKRDAD